MALSFADLITPAGTGSAATSFTTASIAPTADRLVLAIILSQAASGTANTPALSGGGVSTWTAGPTVTLSSRRMTVLYALTGSSPTSGAVTIDMSGQSNSVCIWQIVEVDGSLLTGTNGGDAVVQSISHAATSGTNIDLELGTAWADDTNRGLTALFAAATGATFTMVETGFAQLGAHGASGRAMTAFYGRNAADLTLGATASTSTGVKIGLGIEIAAASTAPTPTFTAYPPIRTYGLNRRLN